MISTAAFFRRAGVAAMFGILLPGMAAAASIGYAFGSTIGAAYNRNAGQFSSCQYDIAHTATSGGCSYTSVGSIDRNSSTGAQWSGLTNFYDVSLSSSVDPNGDLHASAHAQYFNYPVDPSNCFNLPCSTSTFASATAFSQDGLAFNAPGGSVPILVIFNIAVDGIISNVSAGEAFASGTFSYGGATTLINGTQNIQTSAQTVNPGGTLFYGFQLDVVANLSCVSNLAAGAHLCAPNATADFSNTAKLTSIVIEDTNGQALTGYTITSTSGANYNSLVAGNAPEPGSWILGMTGVGLLAGRRSFRMKFGRRTRVG